jgi:lipopolysaccharide/colanic/teichoic acid biosynthesis glycosyltransferase
MQIASQREHLRFSAKTMNSDLVWAFSQPIPRCSWRQAAIKDLVERPLAGLLLVLALPVLVTLAVLVKTTSPGPILHRRRVVSQYGSTFEALKFRTMVPDADAVLRRDPGLRAAFEINHKLERDPRVTKIGKWLRKTSLDELPQLLNVVRGEMWLVGPRMIAPEELEKYGRSASQLVSVKPGITGLWQVSGRQDVSYQRRVELDMHYIDNWSLAMDLHILLKTVWVVASMRGAR